MSGHQPPAEGPRDSVDRLLESWAEADPDLDLSPVAIVARLGRLRRIIEAELEAVYSRHGLNGADFSALVTLRRLERPGGVPQSLLMRELNLTSGTVSVRVERLRACGLARRAPDAGDRRNSLIALTPAGRRVFEQVAPAHVDAEDLLLAALDAGQRAQLVGLLRHLLVSFEGSTVEGATPRLGITVAPAHATLAMRRSMGLPDVAGLLVREVEGGGPAGRAGIQMGDVLVAAQGQDLRSIATLYATLKARRAAGTVRLTGVRGADTTFEAVVRLDTQGDDGGPGRTYVSGVTTHTA
jgi:DNA-binding MarR family transcriptional regulator